MGIVFPRLKLTIVDRNRAQNRTIRIIPKKSLAIIYTMILIGINITHHRIITNKDTIWLFNIAMERSTHF